MSYAQVLPIRDEEGLLELYSHDGDLAARDELVARFLPLARQLATRYRNSGEAHDDLVQVACLGLLKAIDRFEPDRGFAFNRFAVPTILGELKRHFRDKGWAVHVSRSTQELVLKVGDALQRLPARLGHSPSPAEVAAEVGAPVEDVLEAMEAATAYEATSLDAPRRGAADDDEPGIVATLGGEEPGYALVEFRQSLAGTLAALPERERLVLHLRFHEDLTQSEIAERVGISQMHVSRLLRRSLDKLGTASGRAA